MVVDSECGMPMDLFHWDGLWDGRETYPGKYFRYNTLVYSLTMRAELNPTDPPELDEADAELLFDPPTHPVANGHSYTSTPTTPGVGSQPNVSWLRRAEYTSRSMTRQSGGAEM